MSDRIEKSVEIKAPVSRVWRALTDHTEFAQWFKVKLQTPFAVGAVTRGNVASPGCEHLKFEVTVTAKEPERYFAFTWHPFPIDPNEDYSKETPTLVEFTLEPMGGGTRLRVVESGFDNIPAHRRAEAFRMNEGGWEAQMKNIAAYVDHAS
jgi:uncharacterized protein YndB with AHSA1/START domain